MEADILEKTEEQAPSIADTDDKPVSKDAKIEEERFVRDSSAVAEQTFPSIHAFESLNGEDKKSDKYDCTESSKKHSKKKLIFAVDLMDAFGNLVSQDLQHGYKFLCDLMSRSLNYGIGPLDRIEHSDFYKQTEDPLFLPDMKLKFEQNKYRIITEFVRDLRNMMEHFIKYYGPDEKMHMKKIQKFDTTVEQKLALLPRNVRELTTIESTHPTKHSQDCPQKRTRHANTALFTTNVINQLKEELEEKKREQKKQLIASKLKLREQQYQELDEWEANLFQGNQKEQMNTMSELAQIGLFLYLCREPLNCGEIPQYDVERFLLLPRESFSLQVVMTSLLGSPYRRTRTNRPIMSYSIWAAKLTRKLDYWYNVLSAACSKDHEQAAERLGIDSKFWSVVGRLRNPLLSTAFHDMTFYQRVWILKSLCENCINDQDVLREAVENQDSADTREYILGTDAQGITYIHFPQFCGTDLRVCCLKPTRKRKQSPQSVAKTSMSPLDTCGTSTGASGSPSARELRLARRKTHAINDPLTPTKKTRRALDRLRDTLNPQQSDEESLNGTFTDSPDSRVRNSPSSCIDGGGGKCHIANSSTDLPTGNSSTPVSNALSKHTDSKFSDSEHADSKHADSADKVSDISDENLVDNTLSRETLCSDNDPATESISCDVDMKENSDTNLLNGKAEKSSAMSESTLDIKDEPFVMDGFAPPIDREVDYEEEKDLITTSDDLESFCIVCESVEQLRQLCFKYRPIPGRKRTEVELHEHLTHLLEELEPWEKKLKAANYKAKETLKKEQENYTEQDSAEWHSEEDEESVCNASECGNEEQTDLPQNTEMKRSKKPKLSKSKEVVEEDMGVSAFGRKRKKRLIPNNAAEQTPKKKKKKCEEQDKSVTASPKDSTNSTTESEKKSHQEDMDEDGYSLVKIHEQMYLIPTKQLANLFKQPGAKGIVQVVDRKVEISSGKKDTVLSNIPNFALHNNSKPKVVKKADTKPQKKKNVKTEESVTDTRETTTSSTISVTKPTETTINSNLKLPISAALASNTHIMTQDQLSKFVISGKQLTQNVNENVIKLPANATAGVYKLLGTNKIVNCSKQSVATSQPPVRMMLRPRAPYIIKQSPTVPTIVNSSLAKNQLAKLVHNIKPTRPKYAGNVTVKSLLQEKNNQIAGNNDSLKIVQSDVLDKAVKAVVTEAIKTSLPTATIQVPTPQSLSLPVMQPRRPPTHTTQAMKGPVPAASTGSSSTVTTACQKSSADTTSAMSVLPDSANQAIAKVVGTSVLAIPPSSFVGNNTQQVPLTLQTVSGQGQKMVLKLVSPNGQPIQTRTGINLVCSSQEPQSGNATGTTSGNAPNTVLFRLASPRTNSPIRISMTPVSKSNNANIPIRMTGQPAKNTVLRMTAPVSIGGQARQPIRINAAPNLGGAQVHAPIRLNSGMTVLPVQLSNPQQSQQVLVNPPTVQQKIIQVAAGTAKNISSAIRQQPKSDAASTAMLLLANAATKTEKLTVNTEKLT